ncbi:response regulator [Microcoleus sp. CAWBG556]|uniref:response regulator n=2 Tax=Microcoleus TaxID=44471 RepID=UPI0025D3C622|nr:response regulator [Microcoleus sp. CAWBG556]
MANKFMKKPVIVCIDDEPDVLESLKIELKKAIGDRCIIETAEGGEDALELLADLRADEHEIALVLSDYIMPDIKGDELLKQIHEQSPDTLTIMLTGQADLQALSNSIKYAKLYRYIQKPWQDEDLQITVVEAIHSYLQDQKLTIETIKRQQANEELKRVNAELEVVNADLKLANEELSASESRLNQFLGALPVGVSVYNPDGSIAYLNHAAQELLDSQTVLARAAQTWRGMDQFYNGESDRLYFPENFPILRALRGESVKVDDVEITQYGLIITLEVTATPIFDSSGNVVFAIAAIQDISERKEAERVLANYQRTLEADIVERTEQLQQAALAAQAANRAKSTFLANMSHELRTPLNAILGFTQIVESSPNLTADDRDNIRIIHRSGEHLLTLINQALDLAKIEAGRMIVFPTNFNLYDLLDEMEDMFQLRAKNQGLQLVFQRNTDVPEYVRTDEVKLRQVLINLLSNAMKFTRVGGVSVRVRPLRQGSSAGTDVGDVMDVTDRSNREEARGNDSEGEIVIAAESPTNLDGSTSYTLPESGNLTENNLDLSGSLFLQFEVEDTGSGISPEELGKVFQAFVQTESGQKAQKGTGLGLTISSQFVRLMGGNITVESEQNRGTIFRFEIEVDAVDAASIPTPEISSQVMGVEPDGISYRILVVDDRKDNRQLLVKMLSPLGFAVKQASNGREAVEMWENWQPHLILMDLQMPVMDGCEATMEIRLRIQQRQSKQAMGEEINVSGVKPLIPKIIALTASTIEGRRSFALFVGCDDFINKPFRKNDIFDTLHKHLGVKYLYSNSTDLMSAGDRHNLSDSQSNDALAYLPILPAQWIDNMRQVIRSADFDLIGITIEEIRDAHPEFAEILQGHLDNFDYQKILNLVAEAEESDRGDEGGTN